MRYNSALHIGLGPPTARWGGQVSEPTAGASPSPPSPSLRSFPPATLGEQRKTPCSCIITNRLVQSLFIYWTNPINSYFHSNALP